MNFKKYNQGQSTLLPTNLKDHLGDSHEAVILNEFIDDLDTTGLINSYTNQHGGATAYNPVMLLKLLIYAYSNSTFSSRKISQKLKQDIAFMYLAGNSQPDFRTINNFRLRKGEYIEDIFVQLVTWSKEMGYAKFETCSLDGTKIEANASKNANIKEEELRKKIKDLLKQSEDIDALEDELYGEDNEDDIDPELKTKEGREKRRKELENNKKRQEATLDKSNDNDNSNKSLCNTTDPNSKLLKMKKGYFANGYNVQHIVEDGIILANHIDNSSADTNALIPTLKKLISNPKKILADKGYASSKNYEYCQTNGIDAYIPPHTQQVDLSKYVYDKKNDTYTDKQGRVYIFKQNMKLKDGEKRKKGLTPKENRKSYKSILYHYFDKKTKKYIYLNVDVQWQKHCELQKKKLSSPKGKKLFKKRSWDVEGVFGNIKNNLKFTKFNLRGLKGVQIEWHLICISHNLKKIMNT
jgi:transposase